MSHIVLPLFSHHKTNTTDSHHLSQILPVRLILPFKASELKFFGVLSPGEIRTFGDFLPNWTSRSKVSALGHFICSLSSPIVGGGVDLANY